MKFLLCCALYGQEQPVQDVQKEEEKISLEQTAEIVQDTAPVDPQVTTDSSVQIPPTSGPTEQQLPQKTEPTVPGHEIITPLISEKQIPEITVPVEKIDQEVEKEHVFEQPILPQPIEEMQEEIKEEEIQDAQLGIDTSTLAEPQGNWLFKRMWWERAQEAYQKIKILIDRIMDKRIEFFMKRGTLDKELFDVFYMEIGMGLGEFTVLMNDLTGELEKEHPKEEILSQEKQRILDSLTLEKTSLDQVKKHIENLKQIDHAIEQSLSTIIEIINSVRKYERDAWEYFKEIGEVLSEKKARELFYKIDVALQNVKQMGNYLDQSFAGYFENLEGRARNSVEQVRKDLQNFKEKGIDLKNSVEQLKKEEIKVIEEAREEEEEIVKKKPKSWWRSIIDTPKSWWNTITSYF